MISRARAAEEGTGIGSPPGYCQVLVTGRLIGRESADQRNIALRQVVNPHRTLIRRRDKTGRSVPLHRQRDSISAAQAQRRDALFQIAPLQLIEQRDEHSRP